MQYTKEINNIIRYNNLFIIFRRGVILILMLLLVITDEFFIFPLVFLIFIYILLSLTTSIDEYYVYTEYNFDAFMYDIKCGIYKLQYKHKDSDQYKKMKLFSLFNIMLGIFFIISYVNVFY